MATIYCMNCGIELEEGTRFCPACGSPTLLGAGLVETEGKAQVACPSCGALNDSGNKHCAACGKRLSHTVSQPSSNVTEGHTSYMDAVRVSADDRKGTLLVGAVAAVALVGVVVGAILFSGVLSGSNSRRGSGQEASDGLVELDGTGIDYDGEVGSAGAPVRATLGEYSWAELSVIAKEMTRRSTRDAALEIAKEYNLVDAEGHMLLATKDLQISNLGVAQMRLVDVYHDDLANGEGKAGMSFMASNIAFTHCINSTDDITGGWESCELRSWLKTTIYNCLDDELRTSIVYVDKLTNNVGHSTDASSVSSTVDTLWLPSMVEMIGPISWTWPSDPDNSDGYNAITNAEGTQYALFSEQGVTAIESNPSIVFQGTDGPLTWWERSCSPSGTSKFRAVGTGGDPAEIWGTSTELGVCLGFCL